MIADIIEIVQNLSRQSVGGFMTIAYSNIPDSLPLDLSTLKLTDEQFYQLCIANPEQPLELTATGILIVISPVAEKVGNAS